MARISIQLPQHLPDAVHRGAQEAGRTLSGLMADALLAKLKEPRRTAAAYEPLPVHSGYGLQPGVDLSDANALEDLMRGQS